jgi:hypothetical protein
MFAIVTVFWALILVVLVCWESVGSNVPLAAVVLTTGKDVKVFEKSMLSALKHLVDVDKFYVITPDKASLEKQVGRKLGHRVKFVDESIFSFRGANISEVMIESVRERGVYPIDGNSPLEKIVYSKLGWFLQQLLKLYAGKVLGLEDFLLLDSDLIWFQNVRFLNRTLADGTKSYNYASSGQWNLNYRATLQKIGGVPAYDWPANQVFRSGIVHHMVIVKKVMDALMQHSEMSHGGLPFWKVMLNESAQELGCHAPRPQICGAGSTLSEYELYFNFALNKFPETVNFRPLLWANGPMPGYLFHPDLKKKHIHADHNRDVWLFYRNPRQMEAFERQILGDTYSGYHFVGYHSYARRRYYEMVEPDYQALCKGVPEPLNTTCSWNGFDQRLNKSRTKSSWFQNCGCFMIRQ